MGASLEAVHPVLMASDVAESIRFYVDRGFTLLFQDLPTAARYAVVERDGVQLHLQWGDPIQWAYPADRPTYRFLVSDVDAIFRDFLDGGKMSQSASGDSPWSAPADTPWGTREFHLRDPGMNGLQFYRPL